MLTRICTEDKNREAILGIVSEYFEGATIIPAVGLYKREVEKSLIIELAHGVEDAKALEEMIEDIRKFNGQECMMVQSFPCNVGPSYSKGDFQEIGAAGHQGLANHRRS